MHKPDLKSKELFADYLIDPNAMHENGDYTAFCPIHEDPSTSKKPSALLSFGEGTNRPMWSCFVCQPQGRDTNMDALVTRWQSKDDNVIPIERAKEPLEPLPTSAGVEDLVKDLFNLENSKALKKLLARRGLTEETCRRWGIGWYGEFERYTIPVWNDDHSGVLDVRMYKIDPGPKDPKYVPWRHKKGRGTNLFGTWQDNDLRPIYLFEGEWDAILAAQDGLNSLTQTGGAGRFKPEWARYFYGRIVYVCYDGDEAGAEGAEKVVRELGDAAEQIYVVTMPEGSDYTDFRVRDGHSLKEFEDLVALAEKKPRRTTPFHKTIPLPTVGRRLSLNELEKASMHGVTAELSLQILGKQGRPYRLPKHVTITCDRKRGLSCKACPMELIHKGKVERTYQPNDADGILLKFVDAKADQKVKEHQRAISARCSDHLRVEEHERQNAVPISVGDSMLFQNQPGYHGVPDLIRTILVFGEPDIREDNIDIRAIGISVPDPKDQQVLIPAWDVSESKTNIDSFSMTVEKLVRLATLFRPADGQSPLAKMVEISDDMAESVTQIRERPYVHVAYDIISHSVLGLTFNGTKLDRGWIEGMIVGDTRTGKTDISKKLNVHYRNGHYQPCSSVTFAGLVGGTSKDDAGRFVARAGVLVKNDKRMAILDESQTLMEHGRTDVIPKMSTVRSSGETQITMIGGDYRAHARVRMLWLANPPNESKMRDQTGIGVVHQIMPAPEDEARLDFAMSVAQGDVADEVINALHDQQESSYPTEDCSDLILWAWSRSSDQVVWAAGVEQYLLDEAIAIGRKYEQAASTLVQSANIRNKIARIAAAIAARTFSTPDGETLVIEHRHVQSAIEFLSVCYENPGFGYAKKAEHVAMQIEKSETNYAMMKAILSDKDPIYTEGSALISALESDRLTTATIKAACGVVDADQYVRILMRSKMLKPSGQYLVKSPTLVRILRELEEEALAEYRKKKRAETK